MFFKKQMLFCFYIPLSVLKTWYPFELDLTHLAVKKNNWKKHAWK